MLRPLTELCYRVGLRYHQMLGSQALASLVTPPAPLAVVLATPLFVLQRSSLLSASTLGQKVNKLISQNVELFILKKLIKKKEFISVYCNLNV